MSTGENARKFNLLIGATGSVAAIKLPMLLSKLHSEYNNLSINLILTSNSKFFLKEELGNLQSFCRVYEDDDEWNNWGKIGDPIMHIELMKTADMLVIAPLDANTLAKLANGISDNLLCCVCRAWDFDKPIYVAPAMNTSMWGHPITKTHTHVLKSWSYGIIPPISKKLACGDTGIGAMAEVDEIISIIDDQIQSRL